MAMARMVTVRMSMSEYECDPKEITRLSFAAIRRETDLSNLPEDIMPIEVMVTAEDPATEAATPQQETVEDATTEAS